MKISQLYRKYLSGSDLDGQPHTVQIVACTQVQVQPHPSVGKVTKLCLELGGLPPDRPNLMLVGAKNAGRLVKIFGDDTDQLIGKQVQIRSEITRIGGEYKLAIIIYKAGELEPEDAEIPF